MFGPEYFNVVGYIVGDGILCKDCAKIEYGLDGNENDNLLSRADITAIYEANSDEWSPDGLSCDDCGEAIFDPSCKECGEGTLEREEDGDGEPLCKNCKAKKEEEEEE
jgi:hypothetical protein